MMKRTGQLLIFILISFCMILVLLIQFSIIPNFTHHFNVSFGAKSRSISRDSEAESLKLKIRRMHEKIKSLQKENNSGNEEGDKVLALGALKECPKYPNDLKGPILLQLKNPPTLKELELLYQDSGSGRIFGIGGHFQPVFMYKCKPRQKTAILIPYRNREQHLRIFLHNMLPVLKRQRLDFRIYVVEQEDQLELLRGHNGNNTALNLTSISNSSVLFNRATLFNVGFVEAMKRDQYDCFVFTDVDLIPENDRNIYECDNSPWHLSAVVDSFNYSLPSLCGGVLALSTKHFLLVNGFSNAYFGWGGEDDDMYSRLLHKNLTILRPTAEIGRYKAIRHKLSKRGEKRFEILEAAKTRFHTDGLSNLRYKVEGVLLTHIFTHIKVSFGQLTKAL